MCHTDVFSFCCHMGTEKHHWWSSVDRLFSDVKEAVSLKALYAGSLVFAIEGHDGAENCWLKAQAWCHAWVGYGNKVERGNHQREGEKLCLWLWI